MEYLRFGRLQHRKRRDWASVDEGCDLGDGGFGRPCISVKMIKDDGEHHIGSVP
jgi:hypothetical protein